MLALVAVLGAGIVVARGTGAAEPIAASGGETISFSGADPVTGEPVSLGDYFGKPVVINVWGSWCPGCSAEAEDLRRFADDHPDVQVLGIDLQDTKDAAKAFYERWRWTHPSVFDPDGEISFSLGLQGTPSTFFLDRKHRMVSRIVGETDMRSAVPVASPRPARGAARIRRTSISESARSVTSASLFAEVGYERNGVYFPNG